MGKRKVALLALVCVALLAVGAGVYCYFVFLSVEPGQLVLEAMENAAKARGYRYAVTAEL